jgi:hypothetical protein
MAPGVIDLRVGLINGEKNLVLKMMKTDYFGCPFQILENISMVLVFAIITIILHFQALKH